MILKSTTESQVIQHVWRHMSETNVPVTAENSTVLGSNVKADEPAWLGLDFERAEYLTDSVLMMVLTGERSDGRDPHLRVPWNHPDDAKPASEDDWAQYRVRPRVSRCFDRAELVNGVWCWVYRKKR